MVVAAVAGEVHQAADLARPAARGRGTEKTSTFLTAACWADDSRSARPVAGTTNQRLHRRQDDKQPAPGAKRGLGDRAVPRCIRRRGQADSERLPDALHHLLAIGDIHQPLHTVARDTDAHPSGDRGGNEFMLETRLTPSARAPLEPARSLGRRPQPFSRVRAPLTADTERHATPGGYPDDRPAPTISGPVDLGPERLGNRSRPPSPSYTVSRRHHAAGGPHREGRAASAKLATLAGYRLAAIWTVLSLAKGATEAVVALRLATTRCSRTPAAVAGMVGAWRTR